ncbi:MAG: hypothetical protein A2289_26245 [Deltaproteobacteria bacterium RIFOXYA12_FULL_58_15]|nr:MAG: hypothetical protein A2289_26245 [Deltaproteobacteria bacterium RIFOXYA12_FULL_58_15]
MLCWQPTKTGMPMKVTTRNVRLRSVRCFTQWLYEHDHASHDASAKVVSAREPVELPRNVLSEAEVFALIAVPDTQTLLGYRDKTIIELLYATAIRVRELTHPDVGDIDIKAGVALIRHGKGKKDRVVPMGKRASTTVQTYLEGIHSELANDGEVALVVSYLGKRISTEAVANLVRSHGRKAKLKTKVTPHILRHACATHMMRRGAPIRHVQELLGHADIKTTQIYTRLTNQELMEAHAKFHPREQDEAL